YDDEKTASLQQYLSNKQNIHFMPIEVSDDTEYIKGVSTYILYITDILINR
ncbi:11108_t:CDS:1, partial [Funneliformis geosporum]